MNDSVISDEEEIALMLMGRGADPMVRNPKQRSALHAAAYGNLPEALQMLIANGADVNAKVGALEKLMFLFVCLFVFKR